MYKLFKHTLYPPSISLPTTFKVSYKLCKKMTKIIKSWTREPFHVMKIFHTFFESSLRKHIFYWISSKNSVGAFSLFRMRFSSIWPFNIIKKVKKHQLYSFYLASSARAWHSNSAICRVSYGPTTQPTSEPTKPSTVLQKTASIIQYKDTDKTATADMWRKK